MLIEHGIDDVDEGFVAREEPVSAGQKIAFEPSLALVFAQHFHNPPIRRKMVIFGINLRHVATVGYFENVLPTIRVVFVGAEDSEVLAI